MKVATALEMREIDRITIEEYGVPSLVLMERAGLAVASRISELFHHRKVIVLCGPGNNGGDGLVVARCLFNRGCRVKVLMTAGIDSLSPDCGIQLEIAKKMGIPVRPGAALDEGETHAAVIVDAVFGTGLARVVSGGAAHLFRSINALGLPVVAVDMPSGISSESGQILGQALRADCTVTFGLPKAGHYLHPGAAYTGRLFVEDIGFPSALIESDSLKLELVDRESVAAAFPLRPRYSHKGDYGHILIVAGSRGKTGAALMAARACLRSGAGLVTLAVPESLMPAFQGRVTEEMTLPLPDRGEGMLTAEAAQAVLRFADRADALAVGPGIGLSDGTKQLVASLLKESPAPLVIDADGLNSIEVSADDLRKAPSPVVLTPHPGEMRRLLHAVRGLDLSVDDIEKDRLGAARDFAAYTGKVLALKGVPTIVAAPDGRGFINTSGNPGMATGGSGDVLTGVIAAFLGRGMEAVRAAAAGVYLHGLAGDIAAAKTGVESLIASDMIDSLPSAFVRLAGSQAEPEA